MLPTLKPGQRILVDRFSHRLGGDPELGDVTVFYPAGGRGHRQPAATPGEGPFYAGGPETRQPCAKPTTDALGDTTFVKRVVGLPGDTIAIVNGHVIRNGKPARGAVRLRRAPAPSATSNPIRDARRATTS